TVTEAENSLSLCTRTLAVNSSTSNVDAGTNAVNSYIRTLAENASVRPSFGKDGNLRKGRRTETSSSANGMYANARAAFAYNAGAAGTIPLNSDTAVARRQDGRARPTLGKDRDWFGGR